MTDTITLKREIVQKAFDNLSDALHSIGNLLQHDDPKTWPPHLKVRDDGEVSLNALKAALAAPVQPVQPAPLTQTCKMCGYIGCDTDACGECPRCHWDELVPTVGNGLRSALNAMLTQFGMDEDEWNKPTFDQARAALSAPPEQAIGVWNGGRVPEPQPVKQAPQYCGTSHCSCIECVMEKKP